MPEIDLATFLTVVYCVVDDLYKAQFGPLKPARPGRKVEMSDSEVVTLALLGQWGLFLHSERGFVEFVRRKWRSFFPRVLSQSAFNRRARDLWGVICALGPEVSRQMELLLPESTPVAFDVLDSVPVPLMRRCRGDKHRLFGEEAQVGHGGSDDEWYYGVQLLLAVHQGGSISGFVFGPANTEERWLADALLRWRISPQAPPPTAQELEGVLGKAHRKGGKRLGPTGPILSASGAGQVAEVPYLADLGFAGEKWTVHWKEDYQAQMLTKKDYAQVQDPQERRERASWLSRRRQVVERVNATLERVFGLKFPGARTLWGLLMRLGAKIAAFNMALYINHLFGRPPFRIFNPFLAN